MKKKDREVLELRQKILKKNDFLVQVAQLSWRLKKAKDHYSIDSNDLETLELLVSDLDDIYNDFMFLAQKELGLMEHTNYDVLTGGKK